MADPTLTTSDLTASSTPTATAAPANVAQAADPAATTPTANPNVGPDSSGNLFQGSALPAVTTTTQTQMTAPDFYTNYLQDVANLGQNAINQGGVAGFSPLQQQAFQMAPQASFSGADTAASAGDLYKQAGTTSAANVVNQYLSPYMRNVVDEMGRLQQQNIQRNVMPALTAAGVGSGGFGSKRQLSATGQTLADMQANLTGQQYGALNTGYNQAMQNAQSDLNRLIQSGQGLGNLAQTQYNIGTGGLNELSTLGALQQAQGQKMLDYPMAQTQAFSKLLSGYQIPTGSTQQTVAPGQQGQFTNSPLSQIAGLGSLLAALFPQQNPTQTAQAGYYQALTNQIANPTTNPADIANTNAAAFNAANLLKTNLGLYNMTVGPNNTFTSATNPGVSYTYDPTAAVGTNPFIQVPADGAPLVKDGGSIRKYADGGTVDPLLADTSVMSIDPTVMYSSFPSVDTTLIDPNMYPIDMVYAGGTPYFNEATGTYVDAPIAMPGSTIDPTLYDPTAVYDTTAVYDPTVIRDVYTPVMYNMAGSGTTTPTTAPTTSPLNRGLSNTQSNRNNSNRRFAFQANKPVVNRPVLPAQAQNRMPTLPVQAQNRMPTLPAQAQNVISTLPTQAQNVVNQLTPHQEMLANAQEARRVAEEYRQQQQRASIAQERMNRGRR